MWGESLRAKAIDQWTREIPIIATRGNIVDRNGVVLAENADTYTVFVRKRAVVGLEKTAKTIANCLDLYENNVLNRIKNTVSSEVIVASHIKKSKIDLLLKENLSGVYYSRDNFRSYPYGEFLSQVLGITSVDNYGQSGLELKYDKYLKGVNGEILYETDIVGVELENTTASYLPATDGLSLKLTIDYGIQSLTEKAVQDAYKIHQAKAVSCIVLDPQTCEILALACSPSYDLNNPPRDDVSSLNKLSRNSVISDSFEPGSSFKIITSAANIEEYFKGNKNAFSLEHIYSSSRYRYVDGQRIKCWSEHKNGKHNSLTLAGGLNNSCNPIFVDIAMSLGKETMYSYIEKFGFGQVTGVDFNGEAQGMLLPKTAVLNVDLARIGFGQTIAVTALQLATAVSTAINGGNYYAPHFVKEIYSSDGIIAETILPTLKRRVISEKTSRTLASMLESVVTDGSGKQAYIEGYKVGGKTSTAQKYENGSIAHGKYVSGFVGFFPSNNPKYLALFSVDEPIGQYYGSLVASPYVRQIFEGIISLKDIPPCK